MKTWLANLAIGTSLLLGVAVCILAVRGRSGSDRASWTYFRYLPDQSVRSNEVHLASDHQQVSLDIGWGQVGPFNGQLVWGNHVNADNSGGEPKWNVRHEPNDGLSSWIMDKTKDTGSAFPISWDSSSRSIAANGDDSTFIRIGISHWLLALILFLPPMWKLNQMRKAYSDGRVVRRPNAPGPEAGVTIAPSA